MKVYVDTIIFDLQKAGGISVYFYELISRLKNDSGIELILIDSGKPKENIYYHKMNLNGVKTVQRHKPFNRYRTVNYRENEKHIFISSYYRYSKNKNAVNVTIVHDFTYEYFSGGLKLWIHHRQKNKAIKKSGKIICISKNTQKDLYQFCKSAAKGKDIQVIYNGVSGAFKPLCEERLKKIESENGFLSKISQPFVMFIGARAGYKCWNEAVSLFKKMPDHYRMVSVGSKDLDDAEKQQLIGIENRHTYIPPVDEDILVYLYNKAEGLLYLSEYEGFGIPVVEAQRCGCPVVAKNKSSIPEVSGEGVYLVNEGAEIDTEELLRFFSEDYACTLDYSWDKCYNEIMDSVGKKQES